MRGVSAEEANERLGLVAQGLHRAARLLAIALLAAVVLLAAAQDDNAANVLAVAAALLLVFLALITIALLRIRRARTWPCSRQAVSITTSGVGHSQRVRAVFRLDDQIHWRCTNLIGIETQCSFAGEALVWVAADGTRGLLATGTRTRLLGSPNARPS